MKKYNEERPRFDEEHKNESYQRLETGRHYLMSVKPSQLTVEAALEAFGFGRDGLKY